MAASTVASILVAFIFCQLFNDSTNEVGLRFYITERQSKPVYPAPITFNLTKSRFIRNGSQLLWQSPYRDSNSGPLA